MRKTSRACTGSSPQRSASFGATTRERASAAGSPAARSSPARGGSLRDGSGRGEFGAPPSEEIFARVASAPDEPGARSFAPSLRSLAFGLFDEPAPPVESPSPGFFGFPCPELGQRLEPLHDPPPECR